MDFESVTIEKEISENTEVKEDGGENLQPPSKGKWVIIGLTTAVIILAVVLGAVLNTSSPKEKIAQAIKNTFSHNSLLLDDLKQFKGIGEGDFTLGVGWTIIGEYDVGVELRRKGEELQIWGKFLSYPYGELVSDYAWVNIMDNHVEAQVSKARDVLFTYNFREPKTGALPSIIGEENLEILDVALAELTAFRKWEAVTEELNLLLLEQYEAMEFEETDKAVYEVQGKRLECKGYKTTILSETVKDFLIKLEAVYEQYDLDYWNTDETYSNPFTRAYASLLNMESLDIIFYLGEKELAAILFKSEDGSELEFVFGGDGTNSWELEVINQEESVLKIENIVEETDELITLSMEGIAAQLEYNSDSGNFFAGLGNDVYTMLGIGGTMEISENEFQMTVDDIIGSYLLKKYTFAYYVKAGAQIDELTGERFDLTHATEADMEKLYMMLEATTQERVTDVDYETQSHMGLARITMK